MAKNEANTQKRGGWNGMLGPTVMERADADTDGEIFQMRDGTILEDAPFYRLEGDGPYANRQYVGAAGIGDDRAVVFQAGIGRTEDRELAWMLHCEFGYKVTPEWPKQRQELTSERPLPVIPGKPAATATKAG